MIMSIITAILARWQIAAGVAALLVLTHGLAYCEGREDGRNAAEAEAALTARKAVERARQADTAAQGATERTSDAIEAGNERAREAADAGSDPLADALRSLRAERAGAGSSAGDPR